MPQTYKQQFAKILSKYFTDLDESKVLSMIETVPNNIEGDLGFPCFQFAKTLKKSPNQIATEIAEKAKKSESGKGIKNIISVGPYINFVIPTSELSDYFFGKIFEKKENFGRSDIGQGKTILIESPGPNTNKPLHLGHVRNMLLGNALENIMKFAGYDVKKVDIINDRGIHICKSMLAYQKFGNGATPESINKKSDHFVGDYYVKYNSELRNYPEMEEEIKEMLVKREAGDEEVRKLRTKMNKWAIEGIRQTYEKYGTHMDKAYYESEYYLKGKEKVLEEFEKGNFYKNDKLNIVFKSKNETYGEKTVLRADGTSVYSTNDIGVVQGRFDDFNIDKMIYVVGNEQKEYFEVLFEIFEAIGYPFASQCHHMSYGMISLPSGKMKSREGTVVDADNLIEEMIDKAKQAEKDRKGENVETDNNLSKNDEKAENIAMGAIKFFILKYGVNKNFIFNPEESLSFEGETGPYLQYTYARCNSIISNYEGQVTNEQYKKTSKKAFFGELVGYKDIIIHLINFEQIVEEAANNYKPDLIAKYLFQLAQMFNIYYAKNKILTEDSEQTLIQICLVFGVMRVVENGLDLLGIKSIKEM